jgi:hypothetical protein
MGRNPATAEAIKIKPREGRFPRREGDERPRRLADRPRTQ